MDKELIKQSLDGNRQAFENLFDMYSKQVKGLLFMLSGNEFDTNDLLQDTFMKAYINLDKYDDRYPFEVWLKAIAKNTFIDYVRRNRIKNKLFVTTGVELAVQVADNSDESLLAIERGEEMVNKIGALDDKYRIVMELRYSEGLEYKEIAERLNLSMASVKTRLFRAKDKLK